MTRLILPCIKRTVDPNPYGKLEKEEDEERRRKTFGHFASSSS